MSTKYLIIAVLALALTLTTCDSEPPPTEAPPPTETPSATPAGLRISELLPGIPGVNNNLEFIELYNAGTEPVDLAGWSLWYRLQDDRDEELVYGWEGRTDIPGHGHYLLVRAGQDVGNVGDAKYDLALFERKGGLALRDPDGQTVDTLVWGEGPAGYITGSPAPAPEGGASLERVPGGDAGNGTTTGDDAADFVVNASPSPQNSGDALTPLPEERLVLRLAVPSSVEPGAEVAYSVEVENLTAGTVQDLRARLPLPEGFEVLSIPSGATEAGGWLEWTIDELASGAKESAVITLESPWTYLSTLLRGAYLEAADWDARAYGPVQPLAVAGGASPISTARTLEGETVTVEGVATMYTGGFYAGSTGTKFYLEDETGGIQVYCPGGKDLVQVDVGDRVRVTGQIEVYRDSLEIVPNTYPDDVEVVEQASGKPSPTPATLQAATSDEGLLGRLIEVEGTAARIEEFTYSYEVDLMDDKGNLLLAYVDKDSGVTAEPLDSGNLYRITGISETYDGNWQIMPRYQTDLAEIHPAELTLDLQARNSVLPGETITYTLTVYNHTDAPLTNVEIRAAPPTEGAAVSEILDGGQMARWSINWTIPELEGGGGSATVRYLVTAEFGVDGIIVTEGALATADQWPEPATESLLVTFVGSGVPIWAIQGWGMASPYAGDTVTTEGIVTGVFPELGGLWIQETETDDYPATSAGLFVLAEELEAPVELGDRVRVKGKVRERSGQTMVEILSLDDLTVLRQGEKLPPAVELDPPLDKEEALVYYEALEGMLVQISEQAVAVAPTTKYGETALVRGDWGIERVMRGDPTGMLIFVDDGSETTHYDATTLPFALKTGDTITGISGPLAYTYENYKIEPITEPVIAPVERALPALEPAGPDQFSIATFNVEDLFDPDTPHPSDPPIPSTRQYRVDLAKTANAIRAMGAPTIVALQEVENAGILADLVEEPALTSYDYQPVLFEGTDSRGIDNAYLVRGNQATIEGAAAYPAPDGLTSRPPLLITTTLHLDSGDVTVYLLNNHFTSMSGGELPTEPRRTAQAEWNITLMERILADNPEAYVAVMGDLNSFYDSPPLDALRQAGLRHVYEFVEPERPYSYIYEGESETLDHILVTPSLYELLVSVAALHIDADYPLPPPDDTTAQRVSDHDPIVVLFSLE